MRVSAPKLVSSLSYPLCTLRSLELLQAQVAHQEEEPAAPTPREKRHEAALRDSADEPAQPHNHAERKAEAERMHGVSIVLR